MPKRRHPELEGYESEPLYTLQIRRRGKTLRERLSWGLIGLSIGLGIAVGVDQLAAGQTFWRPVLAPIASTDSDEWRLGLTEAMSAAELTQTAEFKEDWGKVVLLWQQAIEHMAAVPQGSEHHAAAQQKVQEYQRNLQYAQRNVEVRPPYSTRQRTYWTLGSDRDLVLLIQGTPTQIVQLDNFCQELFYYDNSLVELQNGYVLRYDNFDENLNVVTDQNIALSTQGSNNYWTLGSSKEEVFQIQGTPTRISEYSFLDTSIIYYGESSVELKNERVVSYYNVDNNLSVSAIPPKAHLRDPVPKFWGIGSSRSEVLAVQQQTPQRVSRNDESCEEVFHYGDSTIVFRHGIVTGYQNFSNNLRVH